MNEEDTVRNTRAYTTQGFKKKERKSALCSNLDGPRDRHTRWSKSDRKTDIIWYALYVESKIRAQNSAVKKSGQKIYRHSTKEEILMANQRTKRRSTLWISEEIQTETTVRGYSLIRAAAPVRLTLERLWRNGNRKWCNHFRKQFLQRLEFKGMAT